ncbi:MAG: hypothetical protein GXY49_10570, partial [Syntrophomonadaceae bacterium]|nr:hypothetical protein [Syntrophomonadaceae bacterium]
METGFYAYPSEPLDVGEIIEDSIKQINDSNLAQIRSWKQLRIQGSIIITEICKEIDRCNTFCCDLTYLNANVLFELGYAIAKNKKIWISLNTNVMKAKENYTKLPLTQVGYTSYSNVYDLLTGFQENSPFTNEGYVTLFKQSVEPHKAANEPSKLFYLKSLNTEASIRLTNRIKRSDFSCITDDPTEVPNQPLTWYVKNLYQSVGVVAHFLSDNYQGSDIYNSRYSLISGLAYGLNLPILMLAHRPYECPLDYKDMLIVHTTARECEDIADAWLLDLGDHLTEKRQDLESYKAKMQGQRLFQNIYIGDCVAENESESLNEYFVVTGGYRLALEATQAIFVGKKGTGKTANLYQLSTDIKSDKRNHVCIIKPPTYDLEGIIRILDQTIDVSERGYLIESLWKFLIYSELANSVYTELSQKIPGSQTEIEMEFIKYVDDNEHILLNDFSSRLNNAIKSLTDIGKNVDVSNISESKIKISQLLHDNIIKYLRTKLGNVLSKRNKVCILVDNLDKAWDTRKDLSLLGEFLLGLLGVSRRIGEDLRGQDRWREPVKLSLIIFIRSDIFYYITQNARERDKIQNQVLKWNDSLSLQRIIESRFDYAINQVTSPEDMWARFFCPTVKGISTKDYLTQVIVPRPRDIIYLCTSSISEAVNRGHARVEQEDVISAEESYSQYALYSLVAEDSSLEDLFIGFVGCNCIITYEELSVMIDNYSNKGIEDYDEIIKILCNMGFLGPEISQN